MRRDETYRAAYWKAFEEFFGARNAPVVKAMLLARHEKVDTGKEELDRVCFGLRQTMSWLAEAIERKAIATAGGVPPGPKPAGKRRRRKSPASS